MYPLPVLQDACYLADKKKKDACYLQSNPH